MRSSNIPKKVIKSENQHRIFCIGCRKEINEAFYYSGSVIAGVNFMDKVVKENVILPSGKVDLQETTKTIGFMRRLKGSICQSCSGNYHTVEDINGVKHSIVQTDPNPKFMRQIQAGSEI
jgi:hypothetical protein